jgi:MtrB/PioB family decaheme-associated outer membrane protein
MRPDISNQFRSLIKRTIILLAIIPAVFSLVPHAWSQQKQEEKKKQVETKKPEVKPEPAAEIKSGIFDNLRAIFEIGGRFRSVKGDRPGKFEEYSETPKVFSLQNLTLDFESANSPFLLNFRMLEIGERDARYSAEFGRVGKLRTRILWDQIPKGYSDGRTFELGSSGFLFVNPDMRARLQATPNSGAGASTLGPQLPAQVRQELPFEAAENLRVRSDQFLFTQSFRPRKSWELYVRAQRVRLSGIRPRPTGTFANENTGPLGDPVWEALGVELPEPVDYRTTNLTFGTQYSRSKWRLGIDYDLSLFRNSFESLTWENPFRVTDSLANAPAFGVGRNRFARGQLALPPDSDSHNVNVRASVDLPYKSQLRGTISWGRGTQNEPFLPYTLNSAMRAPNLLAGQPALFGLALPQPSLNGVIRNLSQNYALASKPRSDMNFLFEYRSYKRDNQTPSIVFPGLPAFGDSGVRTAIDFFGLPLENLPTSYTRQNSTATWQWNLNSKLSWEMNYDWEVWNRKLRDAARTNEHSLRGRLNYKPMTNVSFKADYLYSDRTPRFYITQPLSFNPNINTGTAAAPINAGPGWEVTPATRFIRGVALEFNELRRFDESKRIRKNAGVSVDVARWEKVNFSTSFRYLRDDYDKNFYGLHYNVQATLDAEVSYNPQERTSFFAHYSREQNQTEYSGLGHRIIIAARNVTACCPQFPIANTYVRSSRINYDMFDLGFNTTSKDGRLALDVFYGLGFTKDRTDTVNPFTILAVSQRTAGAVDYPDVINRQQQAKVSVSYKLRPGLDVGVRYRFEPYRLDDYYTNNLQPYQAALPTPNGAGTVPVARYLFMDARFTSYHANVATVFLRYTFDFGRQSRSLGK